MPGKRKSLLKKNEVEVAVHRRTCKYSRNTIQKGETCLVVWDDQYARKCYSRAVALLMIDDARETLNAIEVSLDGKTGNEML